MEYRTAQEVRADNEAFLDAWDLGGGSDIIRTGRATELVERYVRPTGKILDCGTGNGLLAEQLHKMGFSDITALDIDDYVPQERRTFFKEIRTADLNVSKFPWDDAMFDAVSAFQVIEHLENPHHFIREIHRVLKPEGTFFLSTPNVFHIFNKLMFLKSGDMPRWRAKNNHIAIFPKGVFEKTVLRYFKQLEIGYIGGEFPYRFFRRFRFPENEWFGKSIYYVLGKKRLPP